MFETKVCRPHRGCREKQTFDLNFPGCERTLLPGDLQGQTDQNTMITSTIYRYININNTYFNKLHLLATPGDETKQTDKH